MLKITVDTVRVDSIIRLEGRLAGPWVEEFENVWRSFQGMNNSVRVRVDLQSVTYVDNCSKRLLKRMYEQGGALIAIGCMTKAIAEEILGDT